MTLHRTCPSLYRIALFGGAVLIAAAARAQAPREYYNPEDFSSEALYATGVVGVGARAAGLAGTFVGIADDATALVYNPAGLAQLTRIEFALGMRYLQEEARHGMFGAEATAAVTRTGLDHVAFAYPFPTYRGSLVAGLGVFRARSNDLRSARLDQRRDSDFVLNDVFRREQRDGLWRVTGGLGVDLTRNLSFGISASYWEGELRDDQYRQLDEDVQGRPPLQAVDRLVTQADVDGFGLDLGILGRVGDFARVGLAIRSPVWLSISGDGEFVHTDGSGTSSEALYIDQDPRLPWSAAAGASVRLRRLLVAADVTFTGWEEFDPDLPPLDPSAPLPGEDTGYASKVALSVGAEYTLPLVPIRVRAGWAFDPQAYELHLGNPATLVDDRHVWSAGAGIVAARAFALDAGVQVAQFKRADTAFRDVFETRDQTRVWLTGAYRY